MKIKIIKADKDRWYHNRIGKVYIAKKIYEIKGKKAHTWLGCYVIRNYRTILRTIDINDAEIVEK